MDGGNGTGQYDSGVQGVYDLQHALENDIDEQQAGGAVGGLVGLTCSPNFNTEPAPPTDSDSGRGHSSLDDVLVCVNV